MKPGFWMAPEDAESPVVLQPIADAADELCRPGTTGTGALSFLATTGAEAMIARCPGVAALLPRIVTALETQTADAPGLLFDLASPGASPGAGLGAEEVTLVGEVLGEGEVSAMVALPDGIVAQIQESVLAGLWRVRFTDAEGRLIADYAEVSAIPQAVRRAAAMTLADFTIGTPPEGAMNVMPVLAEIRDRVRRRQPGDAAHTISLSLLPMTPQDIEFLQESLGTGPVRIVSKGYGSCRIQATAIHGVWSVQFFNTMDTILLDTLEIGHVPIVACAAEEDFRDSAVRLREIEDAYFR
ncbi:MAG: hydrogenase expression/formation C-terminal domain-containing protein [Rhodopila sp.]